MVRNRYLMLLTGAVLAVGFVLACGDGDPVDSTATSGAFAAGGGSGAGSGESSGGGNGDGETLCEKYGGPDVISTVARENVIGTIAEDCRISAFFTQLEEAAFTRVADCLTLQVQELFGCAGVVYAGSLASNGLPCRSMTNAHVGLAISSSDFDALIEDVVAGLGEAGVAEEDIAAAAPALLGLEGDIVEERDGEPTRTECAGGAGGSGS